MPSSEQTAPPTPGGAGAPPEAATPSGQPAEGRDPATGRLHSLDAVRGLAIVIMLMSMNPGSTRDRPMHLTHPAWDGLTFADLFFPLFLFAVGVSMTLSPRAADPRHVLRRVAILILLGIALATLKHEHLGFTGVLQHIAVSYGLAAVVLRAPRRWHLPATVGIGVAMWAAFVVWAWGDDPWARSGTLAHSVDEALFGGFTTEGTLQSVMSTVTVLGGALAGHLVHELADRRELLRAVAVRAAGLIGLALLLALIVPVNKRLWTPSFTVLTLGTSYAWFAASLWLVDIRRLRRWFAPLIHVGTNPIAIYVLFMTALALLSNHGEALTPRFAPLGSYMLGFFVYAIGWTALWWLFARELYRRRVFFKV